MKKTIAILFSLLLAMVVLNIAIADENETPEINETAELNETVVVEEPIIEKNETEPIETNETEDEPIVDENATSACDGVYGITPDHPILWGLERSLERIQELLTFREESKINLGLERARERHCEIIKMMEQKKLDKAEKAAEAYKETLHKIQDRIKNLGNGDVEKDLEKLNKLKEKIDSQLNKERDMIRAKIKLQTDLTGEQRAMLDEIENNLEKAGYDVKEVVKEKKNKVEVKVKAKLEKSDEEQKKQETETRTRENQPGKAKEKETKGNETGSNKGGKKK